MKVPFVNINIKFKNKGWDRYVHLMLIPTIVIGIKKVKKTINFVFKIVIFKPVYTFVLKIESN